MGVKGLWGLVGSDVERLAGEPHAAKIAARVDGLRVAVDLSVWIAQAQGVRLPETSSYVTVDPQARILKVIFERVRLPFLLSPFWPPPKILKKSRVDQVSNWLRFGCVPVAVLEGAGSIFCLTM